MGADNDTDVTSSGYTTETSSYQDENETSDQEDDVTEDTSSYDMTEDDDTTTDYTESTAQDATDAAAVRSASLAPPTSALAQNSESYYDDEIVGNGGNKTGGVGVGQPVRATKHDSIPVTSTGSDGMELLNQRMERILDRTNKKLLEQRRAENLRAAEARRIEENKEGADNEGVAQQDSLATKRWRAAVGRLLEQRAAERQAAQVNWKSIINMATGKGLKKRLKSLPTIWTLWTLFDAVISLMFVAVSQVADERDSGGNSSMERVYNYQLYCSYFQALINVSIAITLARLQVTDPKFKNTNVVNIYMVKLINFLLYVVSLGYPTPFRMAVLTTLCVSIVLQIVIVMAILWRHQLGKVVQKTSEKIPYIIQALLDMRKFTDSTAPFTISMTESLLDWLTSQNNTNGGADLISVLSRRNLFMLTGVLNFVSAIMSTYIIYTSINYRTSLMLDKTLSNITLESSPDGSTFGNATAFSETYVYDYDAVDHHRVHLVVLSGVRYVEFREALPAVLGEHWEEDALLVKMKGEAPTRSTSNWMSMLTGMRASSSGMQGNIQPRERAFDTIFHRAREFNLSTGITATPWLSAIVKRTGLEQFNGDATLGVEYTKDETVYASENVTFFDAARNATMQAMAAASGNPLHSGRIRPDSYDLFLSHFAGANSIAGEVHVDRPLEPEYYHQVKRQVYAVKRAIELAPPDTFVIVVSDHGVTYSQWRGFGGVSPELIDLPLFVYNKDTDFSAARAAASEVEATESVVDLAATCATLLGIPTPRHNEGQLMSWLALTNATTLNEQHLQDLLLQRAVYGSHEVQILTGNLTLREEFEEVYTRARINGSFEAYEEGLLELEGTIKDEEKRYRDVTVTQNVVVAICLNFLLVVLILFILEVSSIADPLHLIAFRKPRQYFQDPDVHSFFVGLAISAFYFLLCYYLLEVVYVWFLGFQSIDASVITDRYSLGIYLVIILVPSAGVHILLNRAFILVFYPAAHEGVSRTWAEGLLKNIELMIWTSPSFQNVHYAYLHRVYGLVGAVLCTSVVVNMLSVHVFIIPFIYNPFFEPDPSHHNSAFQAASLGLISVPIMLLSVINLLQWDRQILNAHAFDTYLSLKSRKDDRMRGRLQKYSNEEPGSSNQSAWKAIIMRSQVITPDMFDKEENKLAEVLAEKELYLKQMEEINTGVEILEAHILHREEELAVEITQLTANLKKDIAVPDNEGSSDTDDEANDADADADVAKQGRRFSKKRKSNGDEVLINDGIDIKALRAEVEQEIAEQAKNDHISQRIAEDGVKLLGYAVDDGFEKRQEDMKEGIEELREKTVDIRKRIQHYQNSLESMRVDRESSVGALKATLEGKVEENEMIKKSLQTMIATREELLETQMSLKQERRELLNDANARILEMTSEEEHLKHRVTKADVDLEKANKKRDSMFAAVKDLSAELTIAERELASHKATVAKYRGMLEEFATE